MIYAVAVLWIVLMGYVCYRIWKRVHFKPIQGIPVIKSDSFLNGFTNFRDEWTMTSIFEQYGPLVQSKLYGQNVLFIADPKLARLALRDVKGKGLFHNSNKIINALSTFSLDTGPEWQLRRNSFRSAFSNVSLKKHVSIVTSMTKKLKSVLGDAATTGETVKIDDLFTQLTIGVICEVAFDMDSQAFEKGSTYLSYVNNLLKHIFKTGWIARLPYAEWLRYLPMEPFNGYRTARAEYSNFKRSILHHMNSKYDKGELAPDSLSESLVKFSRLPGITEHDMLAEVGVFFVAGMDTTAHTLSFTIYALAANPAVQKIAQQEVDSFTSRPHDEGSLPAYLEAVLKESMRRYPTASTGSVRQVRPAEGYDLTDQIHLPQDWWVFVNIWALHNSRAIWGDDVDQFRPERWLEVDSRASKSRSMGGDVFSCGDAEVDPLEADATGEGDGAETSECMPAKKLSNPLASPAVYAGAGMKSDELCFCPFSFGARNCVGMNLSLMEMRATLLTLVSSFHFELGDESMIDEKKMISTPTTFTMRPADGLPIKISKRK